MEGYIILQVVIRYRPKVLENWDKNLGLLKVRQGILGHALYMGLGEIYVFRDKSLVLARAFFRLDPVGKFKCKEEYE